MTFLGFLTLFDPLKEGIVQTVGELRDLGIALKIITGDSQYIAASIVAQMGPENNKILTGPEIHQLSDGALLKQVGEVSVFAEVEPNEKERIIIALKKAGYIVGYMGDGINDAPALRETDIGLA